VEFKRTSPAKCGGGFNLMKLKYKIFFLFFLFPFSFFISFDSYSASLENIPLDSWVYPAIDELYLSGFFPKLHKNIKPYTRGEITEYLVEVGKKVEDKSLILTDYQIWLFKKLNREFCWEIKESDEEKNKVKYGINPYFYFTQNRADTSWVKGKLYLEGAFQWKKRLVLKDRITIDTKAEKETNIYGKKWQKNLTGVFDASYIQLNLNHLSFLFGRDFIRFGPGQKDFLLLSGFSPPLDMLKIEGRVGKFKLIFLASILDQMILQDISYKRYFSAHRLNFKPKPWLELGVSEVIVYGGEKRSIEPYYLNPILFYYGEQWNSGYDDNPLWGFDFSFTRLRNTEIYGELLVDDFQYDFKSEPQQIGVRLGLFRANIFKRGLLNLEYERISNWVYGQNKPWNRYTFHHIGMGSLLGPDGDFIYLSFLYHKSYAFQFSFSGEYKRKGEGRIETPQIGAVPKTKFPSGIVEYTKSLQFGAFYQPNVHLMIKADLGYNKVDNFQNQKGKDQDNLFFRLRVNYNFWSEKSF
jgi:hypothetical protein